MLAFALGVRLHCKVARVIRVDHMAFVRLRSSCSTVVGSLVDACNHGVCVVDWLFIFAPRCLSRHTIFGGRIVSVLDPNRKYRLLSFDILH